MELYGSKVFYKNIEIKMVFNPNQIVINKDGNCNPQGNHEVNNSKKKKSKNNDKELKCYTRKYLFNTKEDSKG